MIRCIAIDDEPLAIQQIERYVEDAPSLELVSSFTSAIKATAFLKQNKIDLMFVDINMPDLNGMDFVKSLQSPPKVIFTTASSEYALEGFKVDALDYLLKPIGIGDFLKSANKAIDYFESKIPRENIFTKEDKFLLIKSGYAITRVNLSDITYIESMREYVRIHQLDQKPVMSLISLKKIEEQLPQDEFMRVHRSYIVRLDKVQTIERNRILFDEGVFIPISSQYQEKFQEFLDKNLLK